MNEFVFANWKNQPMLEIYAGISACQLWQGETGATMVVKIEPGGKWQGIDVHETRSE